MSARYREQLPTREQIEAVDDLDALRVLKEDVDLRIAKMETDLEFVAGNDEWASRARNALALHRHVERLLHKRISALEKGRLRQTCPMRPEAQTSPLTLECLREPVKVDAMSIATVAEIDDKTAWLVERINAVAADRDDEIAMAAADRDEGFLATTGSTLRELRALRVALQTRRAEIAKAERAAKQAELDRTRERQFVEAARNILPRETYVAIWAHVERKAAIEALAPSPIKYNPKTLEPVG